MATYIVAYDLRTPGQDYSRLTDILNSLPHCYAQQSVWLVEYSGSAIALRDLLQRHVDYNDKVFVGLLADWAGCGMQVCADWLNNTGL